MRVETRCRHIDYTILLAARFILRTSPHRQDITYHGLCYTSRGALAGTRNGSMGPQWRVDPTTHRTMSERPYHGATFMCIISQTGYHIPRLCYTSRGALAGTRNSSMGLPWRIAPWANALTTELHLAPILRCTSLAIDYGTLKVQLYLNYNGSGLTWDFNLKTASSSTLQH